jgi:hypothetical protein
MSPVPPSTFADGTPSMIELNQYIGRIVMSALPTYVLSTVVNSPGGKAKVLADS